MIDQEGYSERTVTVRSCGLCKYHKQHMRRSGRQPLYHHFCMHPDMVRKVVERHKSGLTIRIQLLGDPDSGMFIGDTSDTPDWCPYIPKTDNKGNADD